jgi:ribosome-associated heat shock protein Hsp15
VRVGDVLAFLTHQGRVQVVRIEALPTRRGPPDEGRACYQSLVVGGGDGATPPKAENGSHEGPID